MTHERLIGRLLVSIIERSVHWRTVRPSLRCWSNALRAPERRIARALELMRADPANVPSKERLSRDAGSSHFFHDHAGSSPRTVLAVSALHDS
ncbi:hypothetical protein ACOXXX_19560 [Thalassococcus sp. BH17M4-6]|uniref:hypothetical protein n=1 Tax=Thalassococcus sp. BH17M4-6 TaxID=3413148 RepID=UPI003BBE7135